MPLESILDSRHPAGLQLEALFRPFPVGSDECFCKGLGMKIAVLVVLMVAAYIVVHGDQHASRAMVSRFFCESEIHFTVFYIL